ncbi:hypothetical protein Pan44_07360 [Caulifigura coniformis]|uniref:DUF3592 domain-containing protein n=1 Tax=Caulifigura coniformis TaxID=2527983 RepID=A0A517S9C1_9PLAN|nr:DUF3592 domain-containing protein [Caulifigura coniformis]QDT52724.1 hypothetical protein Pan44_07360 [Caulifigura coniformis]
MGVFIPFISIFYIAGFVILGWVVRGAYQSTQAATWPTAAGTITSLEVDDVSDSDGTAYEVKVHYSYSVAGTDYEGSRLAFGYGASSGWKAAQQIRERLQQAREVAVRYDPADPSVSCLSYGFHRTLQCVLAFGITWLLFVIGFTLMFWLFSRPDTVLLNNLLVQ